MKTWLFFVLSVFLSASVHAANYATCLLDKAPGLQNDAAAMAAYQVCRNLYPETFLGVEQGSGRGWLSYKSGAECALKKAADTSSALAGRLILMACKKLYSEPLPGR